MVGDNAAKSADVRRSGGRMVRADGVDLCAETCGDRADPAIPLAHGAMTSIGVVVVRARRA